LPRPKNRGAKDQPQAHKAKSSGIPDRHRGAAESHRWWNTLQDQFGKIAATAAAVTAATPAKKPARPPRPSGPARQAKSA